METTFSTDFKKSFLLTFTKQLIRHSEKRDIIKLQKIIETEEISKEKTISRKPIPIFTREIKTPLIPIRESVKKPLEIQQKIKPQIRQFVKPAPTLLFIPEPKLPEHLEYLKPIPTPGVEIDLFKINPLIKDPAVRIIEANPDEKVMVIGTMGTKPTDIVLNKEDMDRIINTFSEASKIPTTEGIYRVVVGNLILSAIISETIGSRFTIKKMVVNPNPTNKQPQLQTLPFQNSNLR
jgi:hypothetical protein